MSEFSGKVVMITGAGSAMWHWGRRLNSWEKRAGKRCHPDVSRATQAETAGRKTGFCNASLRRHDHVDFRRV
jgi:hypothetical protein